MSELIRRNADLLGLVQTPNERSSHSIPTPTGGGLGIAIATLFCSIFIGSDIFVPLAVSAGAALLGLLDDRFDLSVRLRLTLHFAFIGLILMEFGSMPTLNTPLGALPPWLLGALLMFGGVWWINLYNFMDGIDGLAASQAVFMTVSAVTLIQMQANVPAVDLLNWGLVIAAASAGFLVVNWPPAKIFMGDAGSNFLATAIFAFFMGLIAGGQLGLPEFMILSGLFLCDATITLLGRVLSSSSTFAAHRLHAYQKLSRRRGGHTAATLTYLAINVGWLYPLAYLAQTHEEPAWLLALLAYLPIAFFCVIFRAGRPDSQPVPGKRDDK